MRIVLIPTDFSAHTKDEIDYALQPHICVRTNFCFLHAYADRVYAPFKKNDGEVVAARKKAIIENADTELGELVEKVKVKTRNPKHGHKPISACDSLVDVFSDAEHAQIIHQR